MTAPFHDRDGFIWMDGRMMPWRDANIHILTHGLHYASSVFEGERAYGGRIFESGWHTKRLFRSAELLGMAMPFTQDQINQAKMETLAVNKLKDAYIRPLVWRGSEQMGVSAPKTLTHVMIAAWEWPSYYSAEMREKGIRLMSTPWRKPDPRTAPTESKAGCLYAISTIAKHSADAAGCQDCLMLDYRGFVAEATSANIFFVKDGALHTPDPHCFLNGITRQTILAMAKKMNIETHVRDITPEELPGFDECFLTGTAAEVTAVGFVDDTIKFTVGDTTRRIRDAYADLVRSV